MLRVSELFQLKQKQDALDFVDVNVDGDTPLFIDPPSFATLGNPWANACASSIQSFFQRVLDAAIDGDEATGLALLANLSEPNETHLGLSEGRSRGTAVGDELADKFWAELSSSEATKSGLISDLEDTALLIEGVREDRISDVTTCIIRTQLIEYTQEACAYYEIPVHESVFAGSEWDPSKAEWTNRTHDLPIAAGIALLLVPKSIVRRKLHLDPGEYFRHHVLNFLWSEEIAKVSRLAVAARGRPPITKGAVEEKYRGLFDSRRDNPGADKRINTYVSKRNRETLINYKEDKATHPGSPLQNSDIASATGSPVEGLRNQLKVVLDTPTGGDAAHDYHKRVEALFTSMFYPHLLHPVREQRLHEDRKRIDIMYTNAAQSGFFWWLGQHYSAANVVVECKNYTRPIGNPEYDQISGRFSPSRGRFGLLVYRGYVDKERVQASCKDTASDDRGWILALDDDDLTRLVEERIAGVTESFGYLHELFNELNGLTG